MNTADVYRIAALLELADAYPGARTVREIARRRGIPLPFLSRLLGELARAGLVATARGPKGGARLARGPEDVTLATVLAGEARQQGGGAAVRWLAGRIGAVRDDLLRAMTLADLLRVEREAASAVGYEI
ncbi:MAG: Rrf2 family transcriptional regulator [Acidobacteriota bacterium]